MASTSDSIGVSCGEEMTKFMMQIVELMLKARDREALIDKAVDRTVEIAGRFDGRNITKFLAMY
jgi:DNA-binding protein